LEIQQVHILIFTKLRVSTVKEKLNTVEFLLKEKGRQPDSLTGEVLAPASAE